MITAVGPLNLTPNKVNYMWQCLSWGTSEWFYANQDANDGIISSSKTQYQMEWKISPCLSMLILGGHRMCSFWSVPKTGNISVKVAGLVIFILFNLMSSTSTNVFCLCSLHYHQLTVYLSFLSSTFPLIPALWGHQSATFLHPDLIKKILNC